MFNFLKKKKEGEEVAEETTAPEDSEKEEKKEEAPIDVKGSAGLIKLSSEITKIKASVEAFTEVRKSFTERFTRTSEQIGELRSMILERDKTIQEIELKALKAHDLVESVHPEKISVMVQKEDAKVEALKANLEGNESIMSRIMEELKDIKKKIEFFRGIEEIIKLSEEVKKELIEIKKVESQININADKVDTIYGEMRKKLQVVDTFDSEVQETKVAVEQNTKDVNFMKDKMIGLAEKEDLERVMNKVQRYVDALKEVQKKSSISKDLDQLKTIMDSL